MLDELNISAQEEARSNQISISQSKNDLPLNKTQDEIGPEYTSLFQKDVIFGPPDPCFSEMPQVNLVTFNEENSLPNMTEPM